MLEQHIIDRILEAARTILQRDGVSQLTFRAVAREAGISVGTLAYYFESRAKLLETLLDAHHDEFGKMAQSVLELKKDEIEENLETIRALVRYAFDRQADNRLRIATWMVEWKIPPDRADSSSALLHRATSGLDTDRWSPVERLVVMQMLVYGTQIFAALAPEELCRVTTVDSPAEARQVVEATIGRMVSLLFS
jgi:AcrR family transcriptional regulator